MTANEILVKIDNYDTKAQEWAAALYESHAADHEWIARQNLAADRIGTASGTESSSGRYADAAERVAEDLEYEQYRANEDVFTFVPATEQLASRCLGLPAYADRETPDQTAPHGEQQAQVDWLESRGDQDYDPADYDGPEDYDGESE